MIPFTTIKKSPLTFTMRILALVIILSMVGINIDLMPEQIQRLKQGSVKDIFFEAGQYGDEAIVDFSSPEAIEMGVSMGDKVLNPEVNTVGEIGTSVTFLIESGDAPAREVTFIRKSDHYSGYLMGLLRLSPGAELYLGIIFLWTSLIFTGIFSLVAFWFHWEAWLAFLVVMSLSHLSALLSMNPMWVFFRLFVPSAAIFFLSDLTQLGEQVARN